MFLSIRSISGIGEAYIACIAPTVLNDLFDPSIRGRDLRNTRLNQFYLFGPETNCDYHAF